MAPIDPRTLEETEERVTTVIAEDVHIKGSLEFRTPLMIRGPLEGEIISEGLPVVGPTAKINATIVTERLISRGEIHRRCDRKRAGGAERGLHPDGKHHDAVSYRGARLYP